MKLFVMMQRLPHYILLIGILQILVACSDATETPYRLATDDEVRSMQRDPASNGARGSGDLVDSHMLMSPSRPIKPGDTARAMELANTIRNAIQKYQDTTAAISAGYEHFVQPATNEIHFTNYAVPITSRFDVDSPTAILYLRTDSGVRLSGAMYNVAGSPEILETVSPLSLVHWHKHVRWCIPKPNEQERWNEKREGQFLFGNFGTNSESVCNRAGGVFIPDVGAWMVHANVDAGKTIDVIWGGTQMGSRRTHAH